MAPSCPNLQVRKWDLEQKQQFIDILDGGAWKILIGLIPRTLDRDNYEFNSKDNKYDSSHVSLIENNAPILKKSCTAILLEEWGTSGRVLPTLGHLLHILTKSEELFRAADFVAEATGQPKPARPHSGPAAVIYPNKIHNDFQSPKGQLRQQALEHAPNKRILPPEIIRKEVPKIVVELADPNFQTNDKNNSVLNNSCELPATIDEKTESDSNSKINDTSNSYSSSQSYQESDEQNESGFRSEENTNYRDTTTHGEKVDSRQLPATIDPFKKINRITQSYQQNKSDSNSETRTKYSKDSTTDVKEVDSFQLPTTLDPFKKINNMSQQNKSLSNSEINDMNNSYTSSQESDQKYDTRSNSETNINYSEDSTTDVTKVDSFQLPVTLDPLKKLNNIPESDQRNKSGSNSEIIDTCNSYTSSQKSDQKYDKRSTSESNTNYSTADVTEVDSFQLPTTLDPFKKNNNMSQSDQQNKLGLNSEINNTSDSFSSSQKSNQQSKSCSSSETYNTTDAGKIDSFQLPATIGQIKQINDNSHPDQENKSFSYSEINYSSNSYSASQSYQSGSNSETNTNYSEFSTSNNEKINSTDPFTNISQSDQQSSDSSSSIPDFKLLGNTNEESPNKENTENSKFSNELLKKRSSPLPVVSLNTHLPHFEYSELKEATDNFNEKPHANGGTFLGKGAFGTVYLAKNLLETPVAVKKLVLNMDNIGAETIRKQFENEVEILSGNKHENLLALHGFSCDGDAFCLVYEFAAGGTLSDRLRVRGNLEWHKRLNIAAGVAKALAYLHTTRKPAIIHRDIKPSNILLDLHDNPKIGDFGLIRHMSSGDTTGIHTSAVGSTFYMSPEAIREYSISVKSDSYSFGIVLLELLTSLPVHDENRDNALLKNHVDDHSENFLESLLDVSVGDWKNKNGENYGEELYEIATKCLKENHKKRIEMVEVSKRLIELQENW